MSRRKQGRPQQRRTIDSLEQENDLLVCGECQTDFPLYDILRFIEHKRNRCKDKENVDLLDKTEFDDGEDSETEAVSCISSKRTSISAPISRKESVESKAAIRPSLDSIGSLKELMVKDESPPNKNHGKTEGKLDETDKKPERLPLLPRQVVDAESNTVHSEPLRFVCEVCRTTVNSAWSLLQHVQKEHGMKIYSSHTEFSASPKPLKAQKPGMLSNAQPQLQTQLHQQQPLSQSQPLPHSHPHPQPSPVHQSHHHHHPTSAQRTTPEQPLHRNLPSAGSMDPSPIPHHQPPQFMFRLPFERQPLSSPASLSPFSRPPGPDFRMDLPPADPFHLRTSAMLGLPSAFEPGPSPPFHNMFERPRLNLENQMDFYSQRLRHLASTTGSPSPVRKPTPPFSQSSPIGPMFSSTPPAMNQSELEKGHGHGSLTPPNKLKSCEFCGKAFRFQSNLIVHRRSHTGEKPFKCPLCPHACTQQSKLKRHMKTHMNKSPMSNMSQASNTSEGSLPSSSSTPDSNKTPYKLEDGMFADDDEMDEEEEEGEEGEEEEELEDELEDDEFDELDDMNDENHVCHMNQNELQHEHEHHNCLPCSHSLNAVDSNMSNRDQSPKDLCISMSGLPEKSSLLSEVMEKSGLNSIQPYNEAFQQALAENIKSSSQNSPSDKKEKVISENGPRYDIKEESLKSGASQNDGSIDMVQDEDFEGGPKPNRIKNEPSELPVTSTAFSPMENWHPGLWFPPTAPPTEFFPGLTLPPGFPRFDRDPNHNGYHSPHECSALKSLNAPKAGPSHGITNGTSSLKRCRNDTCEFCGKIFKNCSNLTVHRRSHTGEKPYKCELCNYACAQSSKLTRHMKTHGRIGKDVYRCKFCSMPFSVASTLEKHMRKCVEINPSHPSRSLMNETTDTDTTSTTASNV